MAREKGMGSLQLEKSGRWTMRVGIKDNPNWVTKTVQILRLLGYRNVETVELLKDGVGDGTLTFQ